MKIFSTLDERPDATPSESRSSRLPYYFALAHFV